MHLKGVETEENGINLSTKPTSHLFYGLGQTRYPLLREGGERLRGPKFTGGFSSWNVRYTVAELTFPEYLRVTATIVTTLDEKSLFFF